MNILYVSVAGTSGYAEAARNYMISLSACFNVEYYPVYYDNTASLRAEDSEFRELDRFKSPLNNYDVLIIHLTPENWERFYYQFRGHNFKKVIGITVWETGTVHPLWIHSCNQEWLSEVWLPVEWNKAVFIKNGVRTPIRVIPHIYPESDTGDSFEPSDRYKTMFDHLSKNYRVYYTIGQWNERKGITETVETFCSAFEADNQVCLVLKTFMDTYSDYDAARCQFTLQKLLKKYKNPPKVFLITDSLPRKHIRLMHKLFDCFFSLCKSEGWGLGAFEAAGEGNYVIITGFGGQTEFLPERYCSLVNYEYEKVKNMERFFWYSVPQYWAKPDVNDAVFKLKKSRFTARKKNADLADHIRQNYGSDAVLKLMSESLTAA